MAGDALVLMTFTQDPSDVKDYDADLVSDDDDVWVSSGAVQISPTGLTAAPAVQISGKQAKIWLQGGTAGTDYFIQCLLTSAMGRKENMKFILKVRRT